MNKPIKILVMSVGVCSENGTAKWLNKLGAKDLATICLPKQFEQCTNTYEEAGFDVYVYNQDKYINDDFEFFGFKPRNCGGVGRQGIAEAVEKYGDDYIVFELDDDTASYVVRNSDGHATNIRSKESLEKIIRALNEFYENCGIELAGRTGATIPSDDFISNHKIFNNFVMHKGNVQNFKGFAALCSDDVRFNIYNNLLNCRPMISTNSFSIGFTQNQGDRKDGNAVIYNGDYSWKKSWSLKMMAPWGVEQRLIKETNRYLFRENIRASVLYPPICVCDEKGEIVGKFA